MGGRRDDDESLARGMFDPASTRPAGPREPRAGPCGVRAEQRGPRRVLDPARPAAAGLRRARSIDSGTTRPKAISARGRGIVATRAQCRCRVAAPAPLERYARLRLASGALREAGAARRCCESRLFFASSFDESRLRSRAAVRDRGAERVPRSGFGDERESPMTPRRPARALVLREASLATM